MKRRLGEKLFRLCLAVLIVLVTNGSATASWIRYWENARITAAYRIKSFAPFRKHPSVWVRWDYRNRGEKYGGKMIQFTADCTKQRLFEISTIPYDHQGNYLGERKHYDTPKEYPLGKDPLNSATYKLLCP